VFNLTAAAWTACPGSGADCAHWPAWKVPRWCSSWAGLSAAGVAAGSSDAAADGGAELPIQGSPDSFRRPLSGHRQWQCHVLLAVAALHCAQLAHNDRDVAAVSVAVVDVAAGGAEMVVHLEQFAAGAAVSVRFSLVAPDCDCLFAFVQDELEVQDDQDVRDDPVVLVDQHPVC